MHELDTCNSSILSSCVSTHNHLWYFAIFRAVSTFQNSKHKHIAKNFAWVPNHLAQLNVFELVCFLDKDLSA